MQIKETDFPNPNAGFIQPDDVGQPAIHYQRGQNNDLWTWNVQRQTWIQQTLGSGGSGSVGPTGPQGPAGPAGTDSVSALTYAATTDIDLAGDAFRTLVLTGNVTFTTSNKAAPRSVTLKITGGASIRTLTFPAWVFIGAAAPTALAANKTAILTITAFGTADTDIVAAYAAQP